MGARPAGPGGPMLLGALATLSYALMVVSLSRGPRYLDPNVVGAIVNLMGAVVPIAVATLYGTCAGDPAQGREVAWALAGGSRSRASPSP